MVAAAQAAGEPIPGSQDYPLHSEKTIGQYFRDQVAIDPDHEFVVYPDRDLRWTYKDFDERTDNLARGMLAIGLKPGDHLGVWARNIPDWLTFMYATAKIGVVMVTVNPVYKSHELDYVLKQSDMKALCVIDRYRDVDYLEIIRGLVPETLTQERGHLESEEYPFLKSIIYMGPEKHRGCYSVPELILLGRYISDDALREAEQQFDNNDVVMMQYNLGHHGLPEGRHAHAPQHPERRLLHRRGPEAHAGGPRDACRCRSSTASAACSASWHASRTAPPWSSSRTSTPVWCSRPSTRSARRPSTACRPCSSPSSTIPTFETFDLSSLRTGIMAGSSCPPETMREAIDRMNLRELTICYGLTETSPVFTQTSADDDLEHKCETVGKRHPPVLVKIVDPETAKSAASASRASCAARATTS